MNIKCPVCQTEYELEPGTYQCECGAKFVVEDSDAVAEAGAPAEDDLNKTIAPRHHVDYDPVDDRTMPGKRDRKPDGLFEPGDLILRRYKVLGSLGRGGMGVVYKCFDETAGIEIALKALPPELSHDEEEMEDIKANFQIVSKLVHQNICISKNLEKDSSNGNYYLIMECVEGEDLRRWIRQKRTEGPLTPDDILPVVRQIAEALDYAHGEGIIHQDIKPGNVMIDQDGRIKILDFGLAAQIHSSMSRVSMAYHGTSGTATYMAPEQWRGQAQRAAADQYALAAMTYEMLAGRLPFEVSDTTLLREAVLNEQPQPIENLPKHVQNALLKALSKKPEDRFSSCSEFVDALEWQKVGGTNRKSGKGMWVALAAVIVLAVIGIGYGYHQSVKAQRLADEQRIAEEQRIAAERQRKAEEQRLAAERQRKAEEQRLAEEQRQRKIREEQEKREAESATAEKERERQESASEVTSSSTATSGIKIISLPNNVKLEMVRIPAGTFMMGSPSGEFRRFSSRENLHHVTITRDFWMSRFEVTQQQYVSIMGNNPPKFRGDRFPVEQVSWINAETFCRKMNELCRKDIPVGYQFALPTEAEWEYACRATTTTCLNNGKNIYSDQGSNEIDEVAWYSRNSNMQTHEVGLKKPNLWGLYDMQGNVSEWCCEWSEQYTGNQVDPITENSQYKSLRSGAYFNDPRHIRQAFRHPVSGSQDLSSTEPCKSGNNGIRLVLVPLRKAAPGKERKKHDSVSAG